MKKILSLFLCMMAFITANAQYNCSVTSSTRETVTFRITGYGKNAKVATDEAERGAVKTILFEGAANTQFRLPLISEEQESAEKNHAAFFEDFYGSGYKKYVNSVIVTSFGKDAQKRKCITLDVCVKALNLRSALEKNKVVRKFGL